MQKTDKRKTAAPIQFVGTETMTAAPEPPPEVVRADQKHSALPSAAATVDEAADNEPPMLPTSPVRRADESATPARLQTTQDRMEAAQARTSSALATMEAAGEKAAVAEQAVIELRQEFMDPTEGFPEDESALSPERVQPAWEAFEKAKGDAERLVMERARAEAAFRRATDAEVCARRAVVAEEYLAVHAEYNDPDNRIAQLREQLTSTIFELIPLIQARRLTHDRLANDLATWPEEERRRLSIPAGRPLQPLSSYESPVQTISLPVPFEEVRGAIMLGVQAAVTAAESNLDYTTALRTAEGWLKGNRVM